MPSWLGQGKHFTMLRTVDKWLHTSKHEQLRVKSRPFFLVGSGLNRARPHAIFQSCSFGSSYVWYNVIKMDAVR